MELDRDLEETRTLSTVDVGVIESDERFRHYLTAIIGGTAGLHNCWTCADGKSAFEHFEQLSPNVVLVSLFLRDMAGTDLIVRARERFPHISFLMLLPDTQPNLFVSALETGACAYLPKACSAEELIRAIWTVSNGGAVVSNTMAKIVVDFFRARGSIINRLTERERQVLACLCDGLSQLETAGRLGIHRETVRTHVRNLMMKLHAHSSAEAVAMYLNPKLQAANRTASSSLVKAGVPIQWTTDSHHLPVPLTPLDEQPRRACSGP